MVFGLTPEAPDEESEAGEEDFPAFDAGLTDKGEPEYNSGLMDEGVLDGIPPRAEHEKPMMTQWTWALMSASESQRKVR
jgi:hypothetical protein